MTRIKILLIDDSGFMRILLSDILRRDESIEIVATASNGFEGVEKVRAHRPDVVVTDMVMPQYDGLYVVQQLMKEMPVPIILLSSLDRTDPRIFDALSEGAFDFVDKPHQDHINSGYAQLTDIVREASLTDFVKLRQRIRGRSTVVHTFEARLNHDIVVIGASTGGPSAVESIITNLPANLSIPVVIAQHMPERFIHSFAARLSETTGARVSVAMNGDHLLPNHIYLAPGSSNIRIVLKNSAPVVEAVSDSYKEFNCPSVDCLFESVAKVYGTRAIGLVLTGMGKDGVSGLMRMREAGALTLSQDENTSIVYGMPKVAFETGAAQHQVALTDIPAFIVNSL